MIERGILPEGTELTPMNPMPDGTFTPDRLRPAVGRAQRGREGGCSAGWRRSTPASRSTPTPRSGRIVDYLEESGQLENTLIFYCADNGASGEGSPERLGQRGQDLRRLPRRPRAEPHHGRPARVAGHLQPLPDRLGDGVLHAVPDVQALHLPGRGLRPAGHPLAQGIAARGEVRHQYHHCTDIVPTIYEACGVELPDVFDGDEQTPLSGVSMVYSSTTPTHRPRSRRSTTRCSAAAASGTRAGRPSPSTDRWRA